VLDLIVSIAAIVIAAAGGLLLGTGTRVRLRFRAEPLCAACRRVVLYDAERGLDVCTGCGASLVPNGVLYFRRRWIWTAVLLGLALLLVAFLVPSAVLLTIRLVADGPPIPLPSAMWFLHAWLVLGVVPGVIGFLAARSLLGTDSAREPLCRECATPLDAKAIFDAGACGSCGQTFLDAGAPRPRHKQALLMWALLGITVASSLIALSLHGLHFAFPTASPAPTNGPDGTSVQPEARDSSR
jgi:ribosomal protein L37AE/L43A